jgi:hypothetical protein
MSRRFPPPWSLEELDVCFVIRDHSGQKLAYVYFEEEPGRRSAAKMLTKDEARRLAVNFERSARSRPAELPLWITRAVVPAHLGLERPWTIKVV